MDQVSFDQITAPTPDTDSAEAAYAAFHAQWDAAQTATERLAAVHRWDEYCRELSTWQALTDLRFNQDTTNDEYKRARDYSDEIDPKLTELAVDMKRTLLNHSPRGELEAEFGTQVFALWEADLLSFEPVIERDLVQEKKLEAEYIELTASAQLEFQGGTHNLEGIRKFREDPDRNVRYESSKVTWDWFSAKRDALDDIYDQQVRLRTAMARKLDCKDFVELGYHRMHRVDYDRGDVARYRAAVREQVVPLAIELRQQQANRLGVDTLYSWDEGIYDPDGNPAPQGDHDWMLGQAQEMFDSMGGGLGNFFRLMVSGNLMDLKNRQGKAGGGFCTSFSSYGLPYVFANFNGTKGDVEVFTHEIGHAFQGYQSRNQRLSDYLCPTYESCEIHSMSLEFLTWPYMELFFGEDAERFRQVHLTQSLLFLPYGVAVDHFQHMVYEAPNATSDERFGMWQEVERMYLPWRKFGDLEHLQRGGQWQLQRHIYLHPFYYIDYTLAQTCALQFWLRAEQDVDEAMEAYVSLCARGGEAPFQELARGAGLISPFDDGCLAAVVEEARKRL